MGWKCRHCNEEITEIRYSVLTSGTEYGNATLSDEKETDTSDIVIEHNYSDSGDTNWEDNCEYECMECDHNIDPEEDLIWIGDEDDEENEEENLEENPNAKIIFSLNHKQSKCIENNQWKNETMDEMINNSTICPKCKYLFPLDIDTNTEKLIKDDELIICPKCNKEFTNKESKKIITKKSLREKNIITITKKHNAKRI